MKSPSEVTYVTPDEAAKQECPLSRTFGDTRPMVGCRGPKCMAWRWVPILASDPRFTSAINREIALLKEERPNASSAVLHKDAVAKVMQDPRANTLPDGPEKGYCGLGGWPGGRD